MQQLPFLHVSFFLSLQAVFSLQPHEPFILPSAFFLAPTLPSFQPSPIPLCDVSLRRFFSTFLIQRLMPLQQPMLSASPFRGPLHVCVFPPLFSTFQPLPILSTFSQPVPLLQSQSLFASLSEGQPQFLSLCVLSPLRRLFSWLLQSLAFPLQQDDASPLALLVLLLITAEVIITFLALISEALTFFAIKVLYLLILSIK